MKDMNKVLAERLPALFKETGTTRSELADYCGVSVNTVSCWVRGLKVPRPDKMLKIAEFFNVKATDLLSKSLNPVLRPVRFLPLMQADGSIVDSDVTASYGSLAAGIDADFVWLAPDETMSVAGIKKGDVCLIKSSAAVRAAHPALIVLDGHTVLRFLEPYDSGLYVHPACPCAQGVLIPGDWHARVRIVGYLRALRREWRSC